MRGFEVDIDLSVGAFGAAAFDGAFPGSMPLAAGSFLVVAAVGAGAELA